MPEMRCSKGAVLTAMVLCYGLLCAFSGRSSIGREVEQERSGALDVGGSGKVDLLRFVVEQNEAARRKIKTAEYRVKWTTDVRLEEGVRRDEGLGEVKLKGDWRYSTKENDALDAETGEKQKQIHSMVINDEYLAYWPTIGNAYIYQDDHKSIKELSDDARMRHDMETTPDIYVFRFAFGGDRTTFKEMMKLHPDKNKWTAQEVKQPNGDTVYLIRRYSPFTNDPTVPSAVWTIDPQKGFLVTEAVFYSRAGNVWVTRRIEAKEIGSGIWVPVTYREHRYSRPDGSEPMKEPDRSTVIKLENVAINGEMPDAHFTIESIWPEEYRESTTLFRKGLGGKTEAYLYRYGRYILREQWQRGEYELESLAGQPLRSLERFGAGLDSNDVKDKKVLVCFYDIDQRPSRFLVRALGKRAEKLRARGVEVVCVQALKVERGKLDGWVKENSIPFSIGMIAGDEERMRFDWGVKSLPWVIVTDEKHVVRGEGLSISEVDKRFGIEMAADTKRRKDAGIQVGRMAPDFELPRLSLVKGKGGKRIGKISSEKIKLSAFRGKRPVCLIFSSYT